MQYNTAGILDIAGDLPMNGSTVVEFVDRETMERAASRVMCKSRYADYRKHHRYATNKLIGVGHGGTIHYILRIERTE